MSDHSLNDLGARGRAEKLADERKERERVSRDAQQDAHHALTIAKVSMTWLGEYWPDDVFDWIQWIVILAAVPLVFPIPEEYKVPIGATLIGAFLFLVLLAWLLGGWLYQKEVAWLAALPFPVSGYLESLGDVSDRTSAPYVSGNAVGVTFRIRVSTDDSVEDIFRGFDPKAEYKVDGGGIIVTKPHFLGGASNYPLHKYFHRIVDRVLTPLAKQRPIASLSVRLNTFKNKMEDDDRS